MNHRVVDSATQRRFDREVRQWDQIYDGGGPWPIRTWNRLTRGNVRRRFDVTFDLIPGWQDAQVLDVGCGSGRYLARAASLGAARLVGIDVAAGMLELAARRVEAAGARAEMHHGTFPDIAVEGGFDAVLVVGVLDYTLDPVPLLAGAARSCVGRVVVTFPSRYAPRSIPRGLYWRFRGLRTRYYTQAELSRIVRLAGLRTEKIVRIGPIFLVVAAPEASSSM